MDHEDERGGPRGAKIELLNGEGDEGEGCLLKGRGCGHSCMACLTAFRKGGCLEGGPFNRRVKLCTILCFGGHHTVSYKSNTFCLTVTVLIEIAGRGI